MFDLFRAFLSEVREEEGEKKKKKKKAKKKAKKKKKKKKTAKEEEEEEDGKKKKKKKKTAKKPQRLKAPFIARAGHRHDAIATSLKCLFPFMENTRPLLGAQANTVPIFRRCSNRVGFGFPSALVNYD